MLPFFNSPAMQSLVFVLIYHIISVGFGVALSHHPTRSLRFNDDLTGIVEESSAMKELETLFRREKNLENIKEKIHELKDQWRILQVPPQKLFNEFASHFGSQLPARSELRILAEYINEYNEVTSKTNQVSLYQMLKNSELEEGNTFKLLARNSDLSLDANENFRANLINNAYDDMLQHHVPPLSAFKYLRLTLGLVFDNAPPFRIWEEYRKKFNAKHHDKAVTTIGVLINYFSVKNVVLKLGNAETSDSPGTKDLAAKFKPALLDEWKSMKQDPSDLLLVLELPKNPDPVVVNMWLLYVNRLTRKTGGAYEYLKRTKEICGDNALHTIIAAAIKIPSMKKDATKVLDENILELLSSSTQRKKTKI